MKFKSINPFTGEVTAEFDPLPMRPVAKRSLEVEKLLRNGESFPFPIV